MKQFKLSNVEGKVLDDSVAMGLVKKVQGADGRTVLRVTSKGVRFAEKVERYCELTGREPLDVLREAVLAAVDAEG